MIAGFPMSGKLRAVCKKDDSGISVLGGWSGETLELRPQKEVTVR